MLKIIINNNNVTSMHKGSGQINMEQNKKHANKQFNRTKIIK